MALKARENINGNSPQDLNKMNNNFMTIWKTLFGGLDFSDTNSALKKKIQTQQLPIQGEGNFDKNFPLYIRFFVPSNVKSLTSSSFNLICEKYRMDSGVAMDGGAVINAPINMSLSTATGAISSSNGGGYSETVTTPVKKWYRYTNGGFKDEQPVTYRPIWANISGDGYASINSTDYVTGTSYDGFGLLGVIKRFVHTNYGQVDYVDMCYFNHEHDVNISIEPHSHNITMEPHTHKATAKLDIPDHSHALKEGIQISSTEATGVSIKLNGTVITSMDSSSNNVKNNLDVTDRINIGAWNVIECTTTSLARITLYGIIELIMNY